MWLIELVQVGDPGHPLAPQGPHWDICFCGFGASGAPASAPCGGGCWSFPVCFLGKEQLGSDF